MKLEKRQREEIIPSIKRQVTEEFGEEIGNLKAELLLDYFMKEIASSAYSSGVRDREDFLRAKPEDLQGSRHEFELSYWKDKKQFSLDQKFIEIGQIGIDLFGIKQSTA